MANLLEIKGLTTRVSGFTILNNLDFSIEENELRVLLGPNGAGKTTLICMITGQFRPAVRIDPFRWPRHHRLGSRRDLSGRNQPQVPGSQHVRDLIGVTTTSWSRCKAGGGCSPRLFQRLSGQERDRIWEILEFVELAEKASDPADSLVPRRAPMARTRHADRLQSETAAA